VEENSEGGTEGIGCVGWLGKRKEKKTGENKLQGATHDKDMKDV